MLKKSIKIATLITFLAAVSTSALADKNHVRKCIDKCSDQKSACMDSCRPKANGPSEKCLMSCSNALDKCEMGCK